MFNVRSTTLLLSLMTSHILFAGQPQEPSQVPSLVGADPFLDPDTGKDAGWVVKNEFGAGTSRSMGNFYVAPYSDFKVPFSQVYWKCHKLRYLVLASDNVVLTGRPEEKSTGLEAEDLSGVDLKVSARLTDERGGVIVAYFWSYDGNKVVGYSQWVYRILPESLKGKLNPAAEGLRALHHMQKWQNGIRNW